MKWHATIKAIGKNAISKKEDLVILFGEEATDNIKDVAVIQKFDEQTPQDTFVIKKGDSVTIDGQVYLVMFVGQMVQANIRTIGHATVIFTDKVPNQPMQNALYLEKDDDDPKPNFEVDAEIIYEHE